MAPGLRNASRKSRGNPPAEARSSPTRLPRWEWYAGRDAALGPGSLAQVPSGDALMNYLSSDIQQALRSEPSSCPQWLLTRRRTPGCRCTSSPGSSDWERCVGRWNRCPVKTPSCRSTWAADCSRPIADVSTREWSRGTPCPQDSLLAENNNRVVAALVGGILWRTPAPTGWLRLYPEEYGLVRPLDHERAAQCLGRGPQAPPNCARRLLRRRLQSACLPCRNPVDVAHVFAHQLGAFPRGTTSLGFSD